MKKTTVFGCGRSVRRSISWVVMVCVVLYGLVEPFDAVRLNANGEAEAPLTPLTLREYVPLSRPFDIVDGREDDGGVAILEGMERIPGTALGACVGVVADVGVPLPSRSCRIDGKELSDPRRFQISPST